MNKNMTSSGNDISGRWSWKNRQGADYKGPFMPSKDFGFGLGNDGGYWWISNKKMIWSGSHLEWWLWQFMEPWYSKCNPQTCIISITWELVRKKKKNLALIPSVLNQNLHFNKLLRWSTCIKVWGEQLKRRHFHEKGEILGRPVKRLWQQFVKPSFLKKIYLDPI